MYAYRLTVFALLLTLACSVSAYADTPTLQNPGDGRVQFYKGYYWTVDSEGDSVIVYVMTDLYVFPQIKFKNKKEKEQYDRLVRNVKLTLPYAKLIAETLVETYEYIETLPTQKDREQFLKNMESEIFKQYKPVLKRFSRTQAKVLIKLVQRETHQTSYEIVKAFLGSFRATFWQGFGKLFGVSLKGQYSPDTNAEDSRIERIATLAERGMI